MALMSKQCKYIGYNSKYYRTIGQLVTVVAWEKAGNKSVITLTFTGTGQLVPKSTRTLVNSYPFLVNSYLS